MGSIKKVKLGQNADKIQFRAKTNTFAQSIFGFYMPDNTSDRSRIFLDKVHLKGYKSIEDLCIDFQKGLNILIGKNGSGKSNFMEVLDQIINANKKSFNYASIVFGTDDDYIFKLDIERSRLPEKKGNDLIDIIKFSEALTINGEKIGFDSGEFGQTFLFKGKKINFHGTLRGVFVSLDYSLQDTFIKFNIPINIKFIDEAGDLAFSREKHFPGFIDPVLSLKCINHILNDVDFFLTKLTLDDKDVTIEEIRPLLTFETEIIDNLKLFSPIDDIRFNSNTILYTTEKAIIVGNIKVEFKVNGNWLPWSQLSDGTKRLFYIIAEVTHSYGLILIEEPELSIHPHQFHLLMNFLKEQSENKQIIISTHAPKALVRCTGLAGQ